MLKWKNQAAGTLSADIVAADTSIALTAGHGARFPATSAEDWFIATLRDTSNNLEVIYVRSRTGDTLDVVERGKDGTTALDFSTLDAVELRWANTDVLGFQDDAVTGPTASGTDTYTANLRLTPKAYNTGQVYAVNVPNAQANTVAAPTLNLSALGAKTIKRRGSIPVAVGDVNGLCLFHYDGTDMILMNPAGGDEAPGTIAMTGCSTAPTGWLLLTPAATAVRAVDVALFTAISTTFGVGDTTTTFGLPETPGRTPIGVGAGAGLTNRALAAAGGEETHALSSAENASHTHTINISDAGHTHVAGEPGHTHGVNIRGDAAGTSSGAGNYLGVGGATIFDSVANNTLNGDAIGATAIDITVNGAVTGISATADAQGSGTAHNTMQPFIALNFIIKR